MTKNIENQPTPELRLELRPTLRRATLDDVDQLVALSHKTILAKYASVIGREAVESYVASGAVPNYYRERNAHCTVAIIDDVPIGVVATKDGMVDLMMVTLEHHRSGIGAVLLAAAEQQLFTDYDTLSLDCFRDNHQAVSFYKKYGWTIERDFVDEEHDIAMIRFVKSK